MDTVWITVIGAILNAVIGAFVGGEIAGLVQFVAYLYLVKKYYETSCGSAFIISIVAVVILIVVMFILVMMGFGFAGPSLIGAF